MDLPAQETPPAKRRKTTSASPMMPGVAAASASQASSPSESSAGGGGGGGARLTRGSSLDMDDSVDVVLDPSLEGSRVCLGCLRGDGDRSYKSEGAVEWLYDSQRGSWCKDCHSVWRNTRKASMTLTLYEIHINQCLANRILHMQYVLAFISLRSENVRRITKDMLEGQRSMLEKFTATVGVPFGPMMVSALPEKRTDAALGSGFPIMCRQEDGTVKLLWLYMMHIMPAAKHSIAIKTTPQQVAFHILQSDLDRDRALFQLRDLSAKDQQDEAAGSETGDAGKDTDKLASAEAPAIPAAELPFFTHCASLSESTSACLKTIASSCVESPQFFKDSAKLLKAHLDKLNKARLDFLQCPFRSCLDRLDSMLAATHSASKFQKSLVSYLKRYQNAQEVFDTSAAMRGWIQSHNLSMSVSMRCLLMKSALHDASRRGSAADIESMLSADLLDGMALNESVESKAKPSVILGQWLEDWFIDSVIMGWMCKHKDAEELSSAIVKELIAIIDVYVSIAAALKTKYKKDSGDDNVMCIHQCHDLLVAMRSIASASDGGASSAEVRKSERLLESKIGKRMHATLQAQSVGQMLWYAADHLCAAGAMDDEARTTLKFAASILMNDSLLQLAPESDSDSKHDGEGKEGQASAKWHAKWSCLLGGQVSNLLNEALDTALNLFQLFSMAGLQSAIDEQKGFFLQFMSRLRVVGELLVLAKCCRRAVLWESKVPAEGDDVDFDQEDFVSDAKATLEKGKVIQFTRGPLFDLLSRIDDKKLLFEKTSVPSQPDEDKSEDEQLKSRRLAAVRAVVMALEGAWQPRFLDKMLGVISDKLSSLVSATQKITPNWSYYIDYEKYNRNLAKEELASDSCRQVLPIQVEALHCFISHTVSTLASLSLGSVKDQPQQLQRTIQEAEMVLNYASLTISVSQAVWVEVLRASQQGRAAAKCLELAPASGFPPRLRKSLISLKQKSTI